MAVCFTCCRDHPIGDACVMLGSPVRRAAELQDRVRELEMRAVTFTPITEETTHLKNRVRSLEVYLRDAEATIDQIRRTADQAQERIEKQWEALAKGDGG